MRGSTCLRGLTVALLLVATAASGCAGDGDPAVATRVSEPPTTLPATGVTDDLAASLEADLGRIDALLEQLGAELSAAAPGHERELVQ